MARSAHPGLAIDVAMTGGHGEWFCQRFDPAGRALGPVASLKPEEATRLLTAAVVAGSQAEALVAARGRGTALPLWPDARAFGALPDGAVWPDPKPSYGRAPDARLPPLPDARLPPLPDARLPPPAKPTPASSA